MEAVLTAILVSVILNTPGYRSIGHNAALAVGATMALLGLVASPISGATRTRRADSGPTSWPTTTTAGGSTSRGLRWGALLAMALIALVRGLPGSKEPGAAEGDELPL